MSAVTTLPSARRPLDRNHGSKAVAWLFWTAAMFPANLVLLAGSLAVRSRLATGEWPSYGNPDPSEFGFHLMLVVLAFIATAAMVVVVPVGGLAVSLLGFGKTVRLPVAISLISSVVVFVLVVNDIGGISNWIAD